MSENWGKAWLTTMAAVDGAGSTFMHDVACGKDVDMLGFLAAVARA